MAMSTEDLAPDVTVPARRRGKGQPESTVVGRRINGYEYPHFTRQKRVSAGGVGVTAKGVTFYCVRNTARS